MITRRPIPVLVGLVLLCCMALIAQYSWSEFASNDKKEQSSGESIVPITSMLLLAEHDSSLVATIDDFVGVWSVAVSIEGTPRLVTATLDAVDDTISGTAVTLGGPPGITTHVITGATVFQGILSFDVPVAVEDEGHPDCVHWDVSCTASLDHTKTLLTVSCAGIECGPGGGKPMSGSLVLTKQHVAAIDDFVGDWSSITWIDDIPITITMTLTSVNDTINGTVVKSLPEPQSTHIITGGTVSSQGLLSFDLPVSLEETDDPLCVDWDVSCAAFLDHTKTVMPMSCWGTQCGPGGGAPWSAPPFVFLKQ